MDVRGVDAGPAGPEVSGALRGLAGLKGHGPAALASLAQSGDTITAILEELSKPEVMKFLEALERQPGPEMAARLEVLIGASVQAAAEGNVHLALAKLTEFAALSPQRAENLDSEPGLASIRAEVGQLQVRLTSTAHVEAELRLGQVAHLLQADFREPLAHQIKPETALLIAGRFLEAGGYANSMRSIEVSQTLINQYGWPTAVPLPIVDLKSVSSNARLELWNEGMPFQKLAGIAAWIKHLWLRAPLLVLLLVWFAGGFLGGSLYALLRKFWPQMWPESLVAGGFEVWGLGFLALIGFGFYARVRNIRW
jgi:hypothetical protein